MKNACCRTIQALSRSSEIHGVVRRVAGCSCKRMQARTVRGEGGREHMILNVRAHLLTLQQLHVGLLVWISSSQELRWVETTNLVLCRLTSRLQALVGLGPACTPSITFSDESSRKRVASYKDGQQVSLVVCRGLFLLSVAEQAGGRSRCWFSPTRILLRER